MVMQWSLCIHGGPLIWGLLQDQDLNQVKQKSMSKLYLTTRLGAGTLRVAT